MFYADIQGSRRPDEKIDGSKALEKGEFGFAYLVGDAKDVSKPIAVAPVASDRSRFDAGSFGGRALVLRADNTVAAGKIDSDGTGKFQGLDLSDPENPK